MCSRPFSVLTFVNKLDKKHSSSLRAAADEDIRSTKHQSLRRSSFHLSELNSLNRGDEGKTRPCKAAESCQHKDVV